MKTYILSNSSSTRSLMYELNQNGVGETHGVGSSCPGFAKEQVNATVLSNSTVVFGDEGLFY